MFPVQAAFGLLTLASACSSMWEMVGGFDPLSLIDRMDAGDVQARDRFPNSARAHLSALSEIVGFEEKEQ